MYRLTLSEREHTLLSNVLVLAAEQYGKNAAEFRRMKPQLEVCEAEDPDGMRFMHSSACDPMAEQFDQQQRDALALMEKIDEAEEV